MPFVERELGVVVGVYARSQPGRAEEFLADDHPEVLAFQIKLAPSDADAAEQALRASKVLLALGRVATGNDTLTEDALVALVRSKLP